MGIFDLDEVITIYAIREAVREGALVEVVKRSWEWLSGGKPVVASINMFQVMSSGEMENVWNRCVDWRRKRDSKTGEKDRFFSATVRHMTVWVVEDDVSIMIMFPEDY